MRNLNWQHRHTPSPTPSIACHRWGRTPRVAGHRSHHPCPRSGYLNCPTTCRGLAEWCTLPYGTPFVTKFNRSNYTKEVNEDVMGTSNSCVTFDPRTVQPFCAACRACMYCLAPKLARYCTIYLAGHFSRLYCRGYYTAGDMSGVTCACVQE